jgi:hypothetical protein
MISSINPRPAIRVGHERLLVGQRAKAAATPLPGRARQGCGNSPPRPFFEQTTCLPFQGKLGSPTSPSDALRNGRLGRRFSPPYRKSLLTCGLRGIMSKPAGASLDKYRDRDLHVSGGRLTRPLATSSGWKERPC